MSEPDTMITVLYGTQELKPVKYWIEFEITKSWWRERKEYFLTCEFSSLGPFDSVEELTKMACMAGSWRDINFKDIRPKTIKDPATH